MAIKEQHTWTYKHPHPWGPLLTWVNSTSPPGQNGRHFADNIFGWIFVNEKFCILIKISLKFVPKGSIDNNPAFGLDNGLAPNKWQDIIWTNAYSVHWHIYAALGGDELTLIQAWMSDYIYHRVWDEITYPFPNFINLELGMDV